MTYYLKLTVWLLALAVTFVASTALFIQSMYDIQFIDNLSRISAFLYALASFVAFAYAGINYPEKIQEHDK